MTETSTLLPAAAAKFSNQFPQGRLCRLVNRRSGTLLDVRSFKLVNDAVPEVVGNAESDGVQYWIITPHGDGQAIIPVPRDGSNGVFYLTPSSVNQTRPVTISPFPASWQILPSSDCPKVAGSPLVGSSVPEGLYEEWTCQISWPHFKTTEPRMLDLWAGLAKANNPVVVYPLSGSQWQFWRIQFIRHQPKSEDPNNHIDKGTDSDINESSVPHVDAQNSIPVRKLWVENILPVEIQILIRPTAADDLGPPVFVGPWIASQDGKEIDVVKLLHEPPQAVANFYFGVRTAEGWTYNVSRAFSPSDSSFLLGFNAYVRGTSSVPLFRFK